MVVMAISHSVSPSVFLGIETCYNRFGIHDETMEDGRAGLGRWTILSVAVNGCIPMNGPGRFSTDLLAGLGAYAVGHSIAFDHTGDVPPPTLHLESIGVDAGVDVAMPFQSTPLAPALGVRAHLFSLEGQLKPLITILLRLDWR